MFGLSKLRKTAQERSDEFKSSVSELELQILWGDLPPEKREQGKRILETLKANLEQKKDDTQMRTLGGGPAIV